MLSHQHMRSNNLSEQQRNKQTNVCAPAKIIEDIVECKLPNWDNTGQGQNGYRDTALRALFTDGQTRSLWRGWEIRLSHPPKTPSLTGTWKNNPTNQPHFSFFIIKTTTTTTKKPANQKHTKTKEQGATNTNKEKIWAMQQTYMQYTYLPHTYLAVATCNLACCKSAECRARPWLQKCTREQQGNARGSTEGWKTKRQNTTTPRVPRGSLTRY